MREIKPYFVVFLFYFIDCMYEGKIRNVKVKNGGGECFRGEELFFNSGGRSVGGKTNLL